jgi:hypothetical protein
MNIDNDPSGSVNDGQFIDQQSDYQFLKKTSAPWAKIVY